MTLDLDTPLTLDELRSVYESATTLTLSAAALARIDTGAAAIARIVESGKTVYGVNTGFGLLANTSIARHDLDDLQRNLVLSHACGTGPLLDDAIVRLVMVLKTASLSRGASGVTRETVTMLCRMLEAEIYPCIPSKG